jgi:viologen exporter family transport system permease protein
VASAYLQLLRAQIRAQTQYRASFVMEVVSNSIITAMDVGAVLVLFHVTPSLAGFGVRQVLVMTGLASTAFALTDLTVGNIDTMRVYIRNGMFDAVLLRPLRVLPQLVFRDFTLRRTGRVVNGVAILAIALSLVDIQWTVWRVVLLVMAPLFGAVIFGSVFVAGSTVAFWFVESGEFANAFTYGGRDFTLYPVGIYPGWFRALFAYGLGFAFVGYFPGLALLGEPDPLGAPAFLAWCSPLVAVAAAAVAALVWRTGVRHYRSTGS